MRRKSYFTSQNLRADITNLSTTPTVEIQRFKGKTSALRGTFPVWSKEISTGNHMLEIPLFGIEININPTQDTKDIVEDTINCFVELSDTNGRGVVKELEDLGWTLVTDSVDETVLTFREGPDIFQHVLKTGQPTSLQVEYC